MSTFLDKKQAAAMLGVSERAIYRFLNRGFLRPAKEGRKVGVLEEDVVQLKLVRTQAETEPLPPLDRENFDLLVARVRALEIRLGTVQRLLGVRYEPLMFADQQLRLHFEAAKMYSEQGWPPHVEPAWADIFVRLRYEDLLQLAKLVDTPHPWAPFLRLCQTMRLVPFDKELRDQLDQGRANLLGLAAIWGQLHCETVKQVNMQVRDEGRPRGVVVHRLEREQKAATASLPAEPCPTADPF